MVSIRAAAPPAQVSILTEEDLETVLLDKLKFRIMLTERLRGAHYFRDNQATNLASEVRNAHRLRATSRFKRASGRKLVEPTTFFKPGTTWPADHYVEVTLRGYPESRMSSFQMEVDANGIQMLKHALIEKGRYRPAGGHKYELKANYLDPTRYLDEVPDPVVLSRRCFNIVSSMLLAQCEEFVELASIAAKRSFTLSGVEIHVDRLEAAVDRIVEWLDQNGSPIAGRSIPPYMLIRRMRVDWENRTTGSLDSGMGFDKLVRRGDSHSIKFYEKARKLDLLRAEVALIRDDSESETPLRFTAQDLQDGKLRSIVLDAVRPYFAEMIRVARAVRKLPEPDLLGFLPELFMGIGVKPEQAQAAGELVIELVRRGWTARDERRGPDDKVLKALRTAGLAHYVAARHRTEPTERFLAWSRSMREAEAELQSLREWASRQRSTGSREPVLAEAD